LSVILYIGEKDSQLAATVAAAQATLGGVRHVGSDDDEAGSTVSLAPSFFLVHSAGCSTSLSCLMRLAALSRSTSMTVVSERVSSRYVGHADVAADGGKGEGEGEEQRGDEDVTVDEAGSECIVSDGRSWRVQQEVGGNETWSAGVAPRCVLPLLPGDAPVLILHGDVLLSEPPADLAVSGSLPPIHRAVAKVLQTPRSLLSLPTLSAADRHTVAASGRIDFAYHGVLVDQGTTGNGGSWWSSTRDRDDLILPHYATVGIPYDDARVSGGARKDHLTTVTAAGLGVAVTSHGVLRELVASSTFATSLASRVRGSSVCGWRFFEADVCLQLGALADPVPVHLATGAGPAGIVLEHPGYTDAARLGEHEATNARAFDTAWASQLRSTVEASYALPRSDVHLTWDMECGTGQVMGFTNEALAFVVPLEERLSTRVSVSDVAGCRSALREAGVAEFRRQAMDRLMERSDKTGDARRFVVIHRDPGRYQTFVWQHKADYFIGRSMFETDRVPEGWVGSANNDEVVQEIWVPSQFNVETFIEAGIREEKLRVVPEGFDGHLFDPATVDAPLDLSALPALLTNVREAEREGEEAQGDRCPQGVYRFLAVGKWEARKGYEDLLTAYDEAFGAQDCVELWLKLSHLSDEDIASVSALLPGGEDAPRVTVVHSMIPQAQLPALYAAADAVVSATHGEGFGLPLLEAMAMGVPVVATNFSGLTAFVQEGIAFPVEPRALVAVPDSLNLPEHRWAAIDTSALASTLRTLVSNPSLGRTVGEAGRAFVVARLSQERVADAVVDRLASLRSTVKHRPDNAPPPPASSSNTRSSYGWGGPVKTPPAPPGRVAIKLIED
jgi:glycosyltransferase involved in cell wall biosynthesis